MRNRQTGQFTLDVSFLKFLISVLLGILHAFI